MVQLERECRSYARYLSGSAPTTYVVTKYRDFHQKMGELQNEAPFDRFLVSVAARGPLWTRLADSYASIWRKRSSLRRKLIVTLALLECSPPTFETLDRCPRGGWTGFALRMALGAGTYVCSAVAGFALFSPIRLWMAVRGR